MPDVHCNPNYNNERADYLANLIIDLRPSNVIVMGDVWDFHSLSSYDKGTRSFQGRTFHADLNSGLEFHDRLFSPIKKTKKKLPRFTWLEGNHEHRLERALDLSPELVGTISFNDLDLSRNYDDIVRYTGKATPGNIEIDGITYAHYFISGVMGRPIGGEHSGYSLVSKQFTSCTVAHSHLFDYCIRHGPNNRSIMGLVAGCYLDYSPDWSGEQSKLWTSGVAVCRNVEQGQYDLQWISMKALRDEYAGRINR